MVSEPARIVRAFSEALGDLEAVRDFGAVDASEKGRLLTFEFIGSRDYFGEGRGGTRIRGSQSTSVDAAFAYRKATGQDALALVEWKFTENYPSRVANSDRKLEERTKRYGKAIRAEDGPIDADDIGLGALFHEPNYQLVRQQLLAHALATDPSVAADVV